MVSDFGKILDPFADKLTQAVVIICLTIRYKWMLLIIVMFTVKESCMVLMNAAVIKRTNTVSSARWYGKVNTVILYLVMMILILFQEIPQMFAGMLIIISGCSIVISFVLYALSYWRMLKN